MATIVYDKAKHHYQGDWPKGLRTKQAFVHTGLFLAWVVDRDLHSQRLQSDHAEHIARAKDRTLKGPDLLDIIGGSLTDDDLSAEGNRFAQFYFDFDKGAFLDDYEKVLGQGLPSLYHVKNTWKNYDKLKECIDRRFAAWKRRKGPARRPKSSRS